MFMFHIDTNQYESLFMGVVFTCKEPLNDKLFYEYHGEKLMELNFLFRVIIFFPILFNRVNGSNFDIRLTSRVNQFSHVKQDSYQIEPHLTLLEFYPCGLMWGRLL